MACGAPASALAPASDGSRLLQHAKLLRGMGLGHNAGEDCMCRHAADEQAVSDMPELASAGET